LSFTNVATQLLGCSFDIKFDKREHESYNPRHKRLLNLCSHNMPATVVWYWSWHRPGRT